MDAALQQRLVRSRVFGVVLMRSKGKRAVCVETKEAVVFCR
jgi:hypothetical protein